MGLDAWIGEKLDWVHPSASIVLIGAFGGLLYLFRQWHRGYMIRRVEWFTRPVFGSIAAFVLTVALGLPNHLTSLFIGYAGIDLWDAFAAKFESRVGKELWFSHKHIKKDDIEREIIEEVDKRMK